jgi:hypothetical protein
VGHHALIDDIGVVSDIERQLHILLDQWHA